MIVSALRSVALAIPSSPQVLGIGAPSLDRPAMASPEPCAGRFAKKIRRSGNKPRAEALSGHAPAGAGSPQKGDRLMVKPIAAALPLLLAALISGCAASGHGTSPGLDRAEIVPATAETPATRSLQGALAPAPFPRRDEFATIEYTELGSGEAGKISLRQRGNTIRGKEADGCRWRRPADWFAPSTSWQKCGTSKTWRTAKADVTVADPIYPLELGATGVYQRVARSKKGKVSARTTRCAVVDAVEVVGKSGKAAPSYVVECRDGRRLRKTWYAPGIGPVAYVQRHHKRGLEDAWQRVF
jgi:hypothetical protein